MFSFNELLGGGITTGKLIELVGESCTGKTQVNNDMILFILKKKSFVFLYVLKLL